MFKINRRTDYAIRVMLCLARREPGRRLPTQSIQQEMRIPPSYLRRIVAVLAHFGLVNSFAGPNGGVELGRAARTINLRQIWEAIEGPILISDCLLDPNACRLEPGCPFNRVWCSLQQSIVRKLESITLKELAEQADHPPECIAITAVESELLAPLEIR